MATTESFISNTAKINEIILTNFKSETMDVTNMVQEINIFDSVYSNCIAGTLDIVDSNDLLEYFPLIGQETLSIDFIIPSFDDNNNFKLIDLRIYKISDRVIVTDKVQHYKLWFISSELIKSFEKKINKVWNSEVSSKIINDAFVYLEADKTIVIEDTISIHNYIATNVSPLQIINYIASHRSINKNKLSDYVFFESFNSAKNGAIYIFASLGSLMQRNAVAELSYNPVVTKNKLGLNVQPYTIENIVFSKGFDVVEQKTNGLYNQTYAYYDILRKKHVIQKNSFDDVFNETKDFKADGEKSNKSFVINTNTFSEYFRPVIVNSFPNKISTSKGIDNIFNKGVSINSKRNSSEYLKSHADQYELNSNLLEQTLYRRQILLREFENNKIYINDISGNYNYVSGNTVIFNKPHIVHNKTEVVTNNSSQYDKYTSGKYLIVRSRHRLTRSRGINWSYKNYLEITKNSVKTKYE